MSYLNEEVLIVGTGGHARFVIAILKRAKWHVRGLITLDNSYSSDERILNQPIIGVIGDLPKFFTQGYKTLVLAVGDNRVRKDIYNELAEFGFRFPTVIHPDACVDSSVSMSGANIVGPNVVIGASVIVGENNIINSSCVVEHESVIGNHCHIAPGAVICGRVVLGDEVMVGANGTIIDKLRVANKTVLGAGATLINSVSIEGETLVGSPARKYQI
jgi:sugar O-acyltransferase (sialic acid O-acetyltransferase NeuD family)